MTRADVPRADDVESLLSAVRHLVSDRADAEAERLDLSPFHCDDATVAANEQAEPVARFGRGQTSADPGLLAAFARLTAIDSAPADVVSEEIQPAGDVAPEPSPTDDGPGDMVPDDDPDGLRALVHEVLREEIRTRLGRRINANIRRIVQEELDARFGAAERPD